MRQGSWLLLCWAFASLQETATFGMMPLFAPRARSPGHISFRTACMNMNNDRIKKESVSLSAMALAAEGVRSVEEVEVGGRSWFDRERLERVDLDEMMHSGPGALKSLYHESGRLVVMFFYKKSCSLCHVYQPILERVMKEYAESGAFHYVSLEVGSNPAETKQAKITAVPHFLVFYQGEMVQEMRGVLSKRSLACRFNGLVMEYGPNPAKSWVQPKMESLIKHSKQVVQMWGKVHEAEHHHLQQFRPLRGSRHGRGIHPALQQATDIIMSAAKPNYSRLRRYLPAWHVLPTMQSEDDI